MLARLIQFVALLALGSSLVTAQSLVYDFETGPSSDVSSSFPAAFTETNGLAVFSAEAELSGRELWVTDGTTLGTTLLADLNPGVADSHPTDFVRLPSGLVLFVAGTPSIGRELYVTDGTALGTGLVLDLEAGPAASTPTCLTVVGNVAFFFADVQGFGIELWTSDGTALGTTLVVDTFAGPVGLVSDLDDAHLAQLGSGAVVFPVQALGWELWKSDGTALGTVKIATLPSPFLSPGPDSLTAFGSRVLMRVSQSFQHMAWVTDGTLFGTYSLGASASKGFATAGLLGYFTHDSATIGEELWVTDGSALGTSLLIDPTPTAGVGSDPQWIGELNNDLLFAATDDFGVRDLYTTNGTTAGTAPISDLAPDVHSATPGSVVHLGELWFATMDNGGSVVKSDGSPSGTFIVGQAQLAQSFESVAGIVVYSASSTPAGNEVWSSPGAAGATGLMLDITPPPLSGDSQPLFLGEFRNETFLSVRPTGSATDELWATDGTPAGTRLVTSTTVPQVASDKPAFARNSELFLFMAEDPALGLEPHFSDGTTAGTSIIDLQPGVAGSDCGSPVAVDDKFLFTAETGQGRELHVSDGTQLGTYPLADIQPGLIGSNPDDFYVHELASGTLLFFSADDGSNGREPWVTNGTGLGTSPLGDLNSGPAGQTGVEFAGLSGVVVFTADDGINGRELWSTDGTFGGTQFLADVVVGPQSSQPRDLRVFADRVFFTVTIGGIDSLWVTDGTLGGTLPFTGFPLPVRSPLTCIDSERAVIWLGDGFSDELWSIDSALFQPQLVRAFDLGNVAVQPYEVEHVGANRVVFAADDGIDGEALWSTDGTAAGTGLIASFPLSDGEPRSMSRAGQHVVFRADDGLNGIELFSVPLAATGAWVGEPYGFGSPGTGGLTPQLTVTGAGSVAAAIPLDVHLSDALSNATAFFAWSRDDGMALLPGGVLWLGATLNFIPLATDANGDTTFSLSPDPAFVGQRFDAQWFVLDPLGSIYGVASATCAVEVQIGL